MKLSQNAQHSLEYVILMTIIMAGIIIGAPYVTRSWNAQMKGWEDSVVDSMNDPLTEAPPDIVSIPGCDFVSWGSCGFTDCCGLGYSLFGNSRSCPARQLLQLGKFKPPDCELSDPSMDFDLISRCYLSGTSSTDPAANHCCTPWVTPSGCDPNDFGCPQDADCGVNVGCPDGQYRHNRVCDTGYPETGCVPDPDCNFTCGGPLTGFVPIANATFCSGDDTGLSGDADYVISSACTPAKCEYVCNPPFVSNGTQCVCPPGCTSSGGTCIGQTCGSFGLCPGSTPRSDGCVGTIFCGLAPQWITIPNMGEKDCLTACTEVGLMPGYDSTGTLCRSPEKTTTGGVDMYCFEWRALTSGRAGFTLVRHYCPRGDCPSVCVLTSTWPGLQREKTYCYAPGQKRDFDKSDRTSACYCQCS